MALDNPDIILKYKIDDKFASNFDELVNIDVSNRKSDIGFTEKDKLMIRMRPGTTQIGNTIAGGTGTSKLYYYTDFTRTRRAFRGYNNKLWYLNSGTWTDTGASFSANDFNFNTVTLPLMINGSTPTTYTTAAEFTITDGAEKVKIAAADPGFGVAGANVGKVLIVLSDPNGSNAFRGVFGTIIDNDGTSYTLLGSGISTYLHTGATYKIYDTVGEYLQVIDGVSNDKYFNGVTQHTPFDGLATLSLRTVTFLTSSQYVQKQVSFNNSMWSFNKSTLFYSGGSLNNPFFHNFTGRYTLPFSGDILDIFTFKNRLVVGGSNFIVVINKDLTYDVISHSFGIKLGSLVDLGEDMYYLSTSGQINSLSENISGTIVSNDIGTQVLNYTKNFLTKISSGFDGRKMYMYGQIDGTTQGTIVVFDLLYKFWSVYTGLRPSSIISEDGITYITDNNSDKVRKFDSTVTTDMGTAIEQKIATKEIDLGDTFSIKILKSIYVWLDNFDQEVYVDAYQSIVKGNTRKLRKLLRVSSVGVTTPSPSLGNGQVGANILGGNANTDKISYPFIEKIPSSVDKGYIWKLIMTGKDGSPFYLNELDAIFEFSGDKRKYFSPANTI